MPANPKIITTMAVLESPNVKGRITKVETYLKADRKADTDRYWADVDLAEKRRKMFPIEYWQLERWMKRPGQAALIVKNIHDPYEVTAKWAGFSPKKPPVLPENSFCFVLSKLFYNGIIEEIKEEGGSSYNMYGLSRVKTHGPESNFLVALLGKVAENDYTLYLQNASARYIEQDPKGTGTSPGGEGAGGAKIP